MHLIITKDGRWDSWHVVDLYQSVGGERQGMASTFFGVFLYELSFVLSCPSFFFVVT